MANPVHLERLKAGDKDLPGADFRDVYMDGSGNFQGANLERADFFRARIIEADFRRANLKGAMLFGANLERGDPRDLDSTLEGANLEGANLAETRLKRVVFRDSNLSRASLRQAYLAGADLENAELSYCALGGTYLGGANLRRANLFAANMQGADLRGANLESANLSQALLGDTVLPGSIASAFGLDDVKFSGPCWVQPEELPRLVGLVNESFLHGIGVPGFLVSRLPDIVASMSAMQFYSCFISYSTKDEEFAKRLHSRMRAEHLRVWFAPEDILGGMKINDQIERAIQEHDRLIVVLSEMSMSSEWIKTEIANARQKEIKTGKSVLFPIRLVDFDTIKHWRVFDADIGKDSAREIREYYIPDFSNWQNEAVFEAAFNKLLQALKVSETLTK